MLGVGTVGGRCLVTETPGELLEQKVFCSVIGVLGRGMDRKHATSSGGGRAGWPRWAPNLVFRPLYTDPSSAHLWGPKIREGFKSTTKTFCSSSDPRWCLRTWFAGISGPACRPLCPANIRGGGVNRTGGNDSIRAIISTPLGRNLVQALNGTPYE